MPSKKNALRYRLRARIPSERPPSISPTAMLAGLAAVVLAFVGLLIFRPAGYTHGAPEPRGPARRGESPAPAVAGSTDPARAVPARGDLPPLPQARRGSARSPEAIRAAYEFAARHPEVLSYIPCFCGCERKGHRSNHDCFVASRDAEGRVAWSPHGMT